MTLPGFSEEVDGHAVRRGRGPTRPFPISPLSDALRLPVSILQYGVDGRIVRRTLLERLEQTKEYNATRDLITSSSKYGLMKGSFASQYLEVTDEGKATAEVLDNPSGSVKKQLFEIGISRIAPFQTLYQKLKDKPLPDISVLKDELSALGVAATDGVKAAEVFTANLRYLDLIVQTKGRGHVRSIESLVEQMHLSEEADVTPTADEVAADKVTSADEPDPSVDRGLRAQERPASNESPQSGAAPNIPSIHINVQIHIDPNSTPEQIDQIFSSMARHLYGRNG